MPQTYQAPVGSGVGVQKFSIKPGGLGLQLGESSPPPPAAPQNGSPDPSPPSTSPPQQPTPPTPFQRLYPGVDPSKVEMELDAKSNRIRFRNIEPPPETPPEIPASTPAPPATPSGAAERDSVAQLRTQLEQQSQLITAMFQAQATGRPIAEILGLQAPQAVEPDYSGLDLYDDAQRGQFIKQLRADALQTARAEVEAQMRGHLPHIQGAQRYGERASVAAQYGKDPNYEHKAALTEKLIGGNPNISFEATYKLVSQIQEGLSNLPGTAKGTPTTSGVPEAKTVTLTPTQQEEKAAQAARYQSTNGGRATGQPTPPPEVAKDFKKLARWVAHQQALGNLD